MATHWQDLEPLLTGRDGRPMTGQLRTRFKAVAVAVDRAARTRALVALAQSVRGRSETPRLLARFAESSDPFIRRLALELAARLPPPLPPKLLPILHPLLRDRHGDALKLHAAVVLLRSAGPADPVAFDTLRSYIHGLGPADALDKLGELRQRIAGSTALDELYDKLDAEIPMVCPRCRARFKRPEMVKHLWTEHRLIIDRDRIREPWKVVRDWVTEYAQRGRAEVLDRCCELAVQLDPDHGLDRVHRMLLVAGVDDPEARAGVFEQARQRQATLCPACYALVPSGGELPPRMLPVGRGRLACQGYTVTVSERGVVSRLTITTPQQTVYDGPEPGRYLTWPGVQLLTTAPMLLGTIAVAWVCPDPAIWALPAVLCLLLATALLDLRLRFTWSRNADPTARAVDHAWANLGPTLADDPPAEGREFLAGLALVSVGRGRPELRERLLERAVTRARQDLARKRGPASELAALVHLQLADAAARGADPVLILADHLGDCLGGQLPLGYAEMLLEEGETNRLSRGEKARLRVLLAGRAFDEGLGPWDMQELGLAVPLLADLLGSDDIARLARLRTIWSMRANRTWQACGAAASAFDIARYPILGGQYLLARPDLLLFQPTVDNAGDGGPSDPILVCAEGVGFRDALLTEPDDPIESTPRAFWQGGGYELVVGRSRYSYRGDPEPLAKRLRVWSAFFFETLLRQAEAMQEDRERTVLLRLLEPKRVNCPECGTNFLKRTGALGALPPQPAAADPLGAADPLPSEDPPSQPTHSAN